MQVQFIHRSRCRVSGGFKVIPQYCIAHPYCARFLRHKRANERARVQNVCWFIRIFYWALERRYLKQQSLSLLDEDMKVSVNVLIYNWYLKGLIKNFKPRPQNMQDLGSSQEFFLNLPRAPLVFFYGSTLRGSKSSFQDSKFQFLEQQHTLVTLEIGWAKTQKTRIAEKEGDYGLEAMISSFGFTRQPFSRKKV